MNKNWFVTGLVIVLLAICLSGCETIAGFGEDITWCAEKTSEALKSD